ncbi:hypothetical protein [Sphingomonas sanxanigenens]|uniref:Uncharacterized protein n=1 Tax=Sphingomonas sanxanigenens DSM 19645 = NX02 TaxID=1123269 RepID=W0AHF5_9SPHN|nr:hypothetical protein [Sphingomonas sanxanigenens]AHE55738.1 hypothetical protein NX02_20485 [Sphingomonas sanxanigenens DSM 19645 = NX02]
MAKELVMPTDDRSWASIALSRLDAWRERRRSDQIRALSEEHLERGLRRTAASMMLEPEGSPGRERAVQTHRAMLTERLRRRGFEL